MSKILKLIVLVLLVSIFTVGCNNVLPSKMPLNNQLKEMLNSKDSNYNFLEDEEFLQIVDDYANTISNIDKEVQYAIGNLDNEDNIPELVVFMDKDPSNIDTRTELALYKFNGDSYVVLDRVDMNHDTSNHLLEIGRISQDQSGLFVSNNVGAHSTITYGFTLEEGKLKSILNDNKLSLISIFPENQIEDIDDDGILEFSIYTVNPETSQSSSNDEDDMMTIWYKWNGNDSANVVTTHSSSTSLENAELSSALNTYAGMKKKDILSNLDEDLKDNSPFVTTKILENYLDRLEENYSKINQSSKLENLFIEKNKYDLSIDRLNNLSYLSRDKVLDVDSRDFLMSNLKLGYKLVESEGQLYFIVDNQKFVDKYGSYISRSFLNYLEIKAFNSNQPYLKDGALVIDRDSLAERIIAIENYRLRFPYSSFISELNTIYNEYVRTFILGSVNTPNYDLDTNQFSQGSISVFKKVLNNHPDTHLSDVLEFVVERLESNSNLMSIDLKRDIEKKI